MKKLLSIIILAAFSWVSLSSFTHWDSLNITIYSFTQSTAFEGKSGYFGHSFITIQNFYNYDFELGYFTLEANSIV